MRLECLDPAPGHAQVLGGGVGVEAQHAIHIQRLLRHVTVNTDVDEAEAVAVARQYLSYFQGVLPAWECEDQRRLRQVIPENRLRIYDVRQVIETLADVSSVLELRRGFGLGMVTALARVEARLLSRVRLM